MYQYHAVIIAVYDGDTVIANIDLGLNVWVQEKIRLFGINAPELNGSQRIDGLASRDYLRKLTLDQKVIIKTIKDKKGKYGRYLGVIHLCDENGNMLPVMPVNTMLVRAGYAIEAEY